MTLLQRGVQHFNEGDYFRCHEVLEEDWTPERGPRRIFLQSLIHIAVALHHCRKGNIAGAVSQLRKGLFKLEGYLPVYEGIDTARLQQDVQVVLARIGGAGDFVSIRIHAPDDKGEPV